MRSQLCAYEFVAMLVCGYPEYARPTLQQDAGDVQNLLPLQQPTGNGMLDVGCRTEYMNTQVRVLANVSAAPMSIGAQA
jgi:hypothetical protein